MNVAHPIAEKVLARLGSRQGTAVPGRDFLDLGQRAAVDQALSRLARQGPSGEYDAGCMNCHESANC